MIQGALIATVIVASSGAGGPGHNLVVDDRAGRAFFIGGQTATLSSTVNLIDARTEQLRGPAFTLFGQYPSGWLAVDPRSGHLFVLSVRLPIQVVSMLDARTGRLLRNVSLPTDGYTTTGWLMDTSPFIVDPGAHRLVVGHFESHRMSVLDTTTGRLLWTMNVSPTRGVMPNGVIVADGIVDERTHHVLVRDQDSETVTVLDASAGRVLGSICTGPAPSEPILDRSTNRVFIQASGTLLVLDARGGRVLTGKQTTAAWDGHLGTAYSPAVDERTGRVLPFIPQGSGMTTTPPSVSVLDTTRL